MGATILIHAPQQAHASGVTAADLDGRWPDIRGAVLAAAVLDSCHLREVTPLPRPVPARGALGLWAPPAEVLAAVQDQMKALAESAAPTGTSR
ncbi:hypothetical protein ACIQKB_36210 [Streptomyces sp. NPDC092046]|uniref:hypothetical protein n=1 Tax=Streptomyces sp. NPDC092046 TaxID=3366009 RepID=UPI003816EB55